MYSHSLNRAWAHEWSETSAPLCLADSDVLSGLPPLTPSIAKHSFRPSRQRPAQPQLHAQPVTLPTGRNSHRLHSATLHFSGVSPYTTGTRGRSASFRVTLPARNCAHHVINTTKAHTYGGSSWLLEKAVRLVITEHECSRSSVNDSSRPRTFILRAANGSSAAPSANEPFTAQPSSASIALTSADGLLRNARQPSTPG